MAEVRLEEDKAPSSSAARRATIASAAGGTHHRWNLSPLTSKNPTMALASAGIWGMWAYSGSLVTFTVPTTQAVERE
jgi:hypothetical protein